MSTALSSSSLSPPCHGGSYREGVWTIARRKTRQRAMDSEHVTICKSVCPDFLTIRGGLVRWTKVPTAGERAPRAGEGRRASQEQHGVEQPLAFFQAPVMVHSRCRKQ